MDSPDQGLRSHTPGDHAVGLTDHSFVRSDGQAGTPVEPASAPQLRARDGHLVLLGGSRAEYRVSEYAGMDRYFEWSDGPSAQTTPELDHELEGRMTS
jgi:hypothetical protein